MPFTELLKSTDFSGLSHAYGPANDAAKQLAGLAGDTVDRRAAGAYLNGVVLHQSTPSAVTATVVELLLRSIEDPTLRDQLSVILGFVSDVADAPSDTGMPVDEDLSSILVVDGVDQREILVDLTRRGGLGGDEGEALLEVGMAWGFEEIFAHARSWWSQVDRFLAGCGGTQNGETSPSSLAIGAAGYALARLATLCEPSVLEATAERLRWLLTTMPAASSDGRPVLVRALGTFESPVEYLDDADRLSRIAAALSPLLKQDERALTLLARELERAADLEPLLERPEYRSVYLNLPNMIAQLTSANIAPELLVDAAIGCLRWTGQTGTGLYQTARFLPRVFPLRTDNQELDLLSPEQSRYLAALLAEGDLFEQFVSGPTGASFAAAGLPTTRRGCSRLIRRSR
ncbi:hypothetical protein G7068_01140 [Leucobacter viscericola]|uniref:Uncharacterized protein n=1 Tax=Leucobacter viscericola TaxID=2714935 RepID=A0A6G7XBN0_9MICO|nr:hypothetical protein [Leucobacter viscericola]QIK61965.1 hypothetical protein G7068_01140 [Leucobacter viscericola]